MLKLLYALEDHFDAMAQEVGSKSVASIFAGLSAVFAVLGDSVKAVSNSGLTNSSVSRDN